MNAGRDVERLIATWLAEEAPGRAPDRVLATAGTRIDRTYQRRRAALRDLWIPWRPGTMFDRLAVAVVSAILAIGALTLGVSLINQPDNAAGPCPPTFREADAIDVSRPGLSQSQRVWGITGGAPGRVRPGPIAMFAYDSANAPLSIVTVDPATGARCRLIRFLVNGQVTQLTSVDWSPSGDALAIAYLPDSGLPEDGPGEVLIWTADRLLRVWSGPGYPYLEWAPDGRSLAVWSDGTDSVSIVRGDGSPDTTVMVHPAFSTSLSWSPDGTRWLVALAPIVLPGTPTTMAVVDVATGRVMPVDLPESQYMPIGWLDDDRVLLLDTQGRDGLRRYLDVPVNEPANWFVLPISSEAIGSEAVLSPDRHTLVYGSQGEGDGGLLTVISVAANAWGTPTQIGPNQNVARIAWSPDGTQLVFATEDGVWTVRADGTNVQQIASGQFVEVDDPWQPVSIP